MGLVQNIEKSSLGLTYFLKILKNEVPQISLQSDSLNSSLLALGRCHLLSGRASYRGSLQQLKYLFTSIVYNSST